MTEETNTDIVNERVDQATGTISRRMFIGSSVFLVSAPLLAGVPNLTNHLLMVSNNGQFFTAEQMTVLVDMADLMIPRTDTPGASDTHVIPLLDSMMLSWAGQKTKVQFPFVIAQVNNLASATFDDNYQVLSKTDRMTLIKSLDSRAFSNQDSDLSRAYRKLKEMIYHIYYSSEAANPDYMPVPGQYRGCVTEEELLKFNQQGYVS